MITPDLIAKRLAKAMKRDAAQLVYRSIAPNIYMVRLPEAFMATWRPFLSQLEQELGEHVSHTAKKLGLDSLPGGFLVRLTADHALKPGKLLIETAFERGRMRPAALSVLEGMPPLVYPLLRPETIIGRGDVDLRLPPEALSVSRRHAKISASDNVYYISDLGSRTGTFVNQRAVRERELASGDSITLGEVTLSFTLKETSLERAKCSA